MPRPGDREAKSREAESRAALDRVAREAETVGASSLARATHRLGDHFTGRDAEGQAEGGGTDPVEIWGRRIGRGISVVLALALTAWFGIQMGWW